MTFQVQTPPGANFDSTSTDAKFALGTQGRGNDGTEWMYVQAQSAVSQYMWVGLTTAFVANPGTKAHLDDGRKVGFAQVAFAANDYGWVAIKGQNSVLKVKAKNACLPAVDLYSSGTAGYVDDTSASQTQIQGITLTDTATSSGAAEELFVPVEAFGNPS